MKREEFCSACVSIKEAAEIMHLSRASVYRLRRSDPRFPRFHKFGRSSRIRLSDLEKYIDRAAEDRS